MIFGKLAAHKEGAIALATQELARKLPTDSERGPKGRSGEAAGKRGSGPPAARNRGQVWPLLKASPDPRVRSYIIHWLKSTSRATRKRSCNNSDIEPDVTIRRALVLTLGQFNETQLPAAQRQPLIQKLLAVYQNEPDAGLHGASRMAASEMGATETARRRR